MSNIKVYEGTSVLENLEPGFYNIENLEHVYTLTSCGKVFNEHGVEVSDGIKVRMLRGDKFVSVGSFKCRCVFPVYSSEGLICLPQGRGYIGTYTFDYQESLESGEEAEEASWEVRVGEPLILESGRLVCSNGYIYSFGLELGYSGKWDCPASKGQRFTVSLTKYHESPLGNKYLKVEQKFMISLGERLGFVFTGLEMMRLVTAEYKFVMESTLEVLRNDERRD